MEDFCAYLLILLSAFALAICLELREAVGLVRRLRDGNGEVVGMLGVKSTARLRRN